MQNFPPSRLHFFLVREIKRIKNLHAAWTEPYKKLSSCSVSSPAVRGTPPAMQVTKIASVHYRQIFVAHSAMQFYCLSTALLIYALSIVRGPHTAGETNLELHFSASLTSQCCTDLT